MMATTSTSSIRVCPSRWTIGRFVILSRYGADHVRPALVQRTPRHSTAATRHAGPSRRDDPSFGTRSCQRPLHCAHNPCHVAAYIELSSPQPWPASRHAETPLRMRTWPSRCGRWAMSSMGRGRKQRRCKTRLIRCASPLPDRTRCCDSWREWPTCRCLGDWQPAPALGVTSKGVSPLRVPNHQLAIFRHTPKAEQR